MYVRGASPVRRSWPPWPDYGPEMEYGVYYYQYQPGYGAGHHGKKRRTEKHKRKSDSICSFFMQGSCFKVGGCSGSI